MNRTKPIQKATLTEGEVEHIRTTLSDGDESVQESERGLEARARRIIATARAEIARGFGEIIWSPIEFAHVAAWIEELEVREHKPTGAESEDDVYALIRAERARQDVQWGGLQHDDRHDPSEWLGFIDKFLAKARTARWQRDREAYRLRLVQIAALAVAALEVLEREDEATRRPTP